MDVLDPSELRIGVMRAEALPFMVFRIHFMQVPQAFNDPARFITIRLPRFSCD